MLSMLSQPTPDRHLTGYVSHVTVRFQAHGPEHIQIRPQSTFRIWLRGPDVGCPTARRTNRPGPI